MSQVKNSINFTYTVHDLWFGKIMEIQKVRKNQTSKLIRGHVSKNNKSLIYLLNLDIKIIEKPSNFLKLWTKTRFSFCLLFICLVFFVPLENFSLIWDVAITGEGLQFLTYIVTFTPVETCRSVAERLAVGLHCIYTCFRELGLSRMGLEPRSTACEATPSRRSKRTYSMTNEDWYWHYCYQT